MVKNMDVHAALTFGSVGEPVVPTAFMEEQLRNELVAETAQACHFGATS